MLENNFIEQVKKYHEDVELDIVEPKGFKLNEYTYVLGDKQKQMIIDAEQKKPYDTFKYYFLQANPTMDADRQVLKGCFGDRWEIQPERGYQNLRIICDDITYSNLIIDQELIDNIIKSIDELHEGLDLDYPEDSSKLLAKGKFGGYVLSTQDKMNFINWLKTISKEDESKVWCSLGSVSNDWVIESLDEHVTGRWGLMMLDAKLNAVMLTCGEKFTDDDNHEQLWTAMLDMPIGLLHNFIAKDVDKVIDVLTNGEGIEEDLELEVVSDYSPDEIARALAEKIGDCIVDGNIVYQMMQDFEIYVENEDDKAYDETVEIPYGIFAIYEVLPNKGVIAWNSSAETCEDVDGIGHNPLSYYTKNPMAVCGNLRQFIDFLDRYFGRDWFGTDEEIEDFLGTYDLSEDLDLDTVDNDAYILVRHGGVSARLTDKGKEDVAIFLDMDDETWDSMKDDEWFIMKNSPELDSWYEDAADDDFPFALVIGDSFYDALGDGTVEAVLNNQEEFSLE